MGDDLRLPPGAERVPLPPPELFWAVLGVLRPPPGAALTGAELDGASTLLTYGRQSERWSYRVEGRAVRAAEWTDGQGGRMTVAVEAVDSGGRPASARYRDWRAFVELDIDVTELEEVEGHPDETWNPAL